jgi:hypothetical protein
MTTGQNRDRTNPSGEAILTNEFASVRVSVDRRGHSPRLRVEDLQGGGGILIDPLELASFTQADDRDRIGWLLVGQYRPTAGGDAGEGGYS